MVTISNGSAGLSSALLQNALAISQNQSLINQVQQRLATGKRVSSPLDNPDNFFTASALSTRATRLNNTLDSILKNLGTIRQASEAVASLNDLEEQIKGVAEDAQDVFNGSTPEATITGNRSLTAFTDLPVDLAGVDNNDTLEFRFVDTDGSINSGNVVTISNGDSINDLINNINAITDAGASQVFNASLDSSGQLTISTQNATRFEIKFEDFGGGADTQLASALGFGNFDTTATSDGTNETRITVLPTVSLTSTPLFDAGGGAAQTSSILLNLTDNSAGAAGDIFDGDTGDAINIGVNGGTTVQVISDILTATLQDLVDGINNNGSLSNQIEATFDTTSRELNIRAVDADVESIQIELDEDAVGAGTAGKIDLQLLGFGTQVLQSAVDGSNTLSSESFLLDSRAADLVALETEFDTLRTQIDDLVSDAEFNDINLLESESLTTTFNVDGTSTLVTTGESLSSTTLGISAANFGTSTSANQAVSDIEDAIDETEAFASALANDIGIIETRQSFTEEVVAESQGAANDLTAADTNEDGALLLTLQARHALSITALALGTQTQQNTLRLF